eukprot:gene9139-16801_t
MVTVWFYKVSESMYADLEIRYGRPGVELSAFHPTETCIQQLFFLPEQGKIISVCDDGELNTLHLWEVSERDGSSVMEEVKACTLEGRLKKISVCCLSMERECLYIGTEGGHIYLLDLCSFGLKDHIIYQDIVMQSLPGDENKTNGGSVEALKEHPFDSSRLLIGYKKGIIVLWNQDKIKAEGTFKASHDLESLYWHHSANQFISAHERGMISIWTIQEAEDCEPIQESSTPYGPFPCKPIRKVEWQDPYVVFSGGLPRASYGDKHAISLLQGNTVQVVFEFTSKVIDFFVIKDAHDSSDFKVILGRVTICPIVVVCFVYAADEPIALAVLCEQEFVMIDLKSKEQGFPSHMPPYLACLHSSTITCSIHCHDCPDELWNRIKSLGEKCFRGEQSKEPWPINGGKSLLKKSNFHDLLVTGHEDGSIKFWDVSQVNMHLMCTIMTSRVLKCDLDDEPPHDPDADDEGWPPFKKVGAFDPLLDDTRFVILKLALCPITQLLIVGGAGGQVIFYNLAKERIESPEYENINVIAKLDGFEWKGNGPLSLKQNIDGTNGILPERVVQLQPPAAVTAVALNSAWQLAAVGTCHGFVAYDYRSGKVALTKCTISPTDLANTGGPIQRRKSFTKSLRDSIRRFRSRKSTRGSRRKRAAGANEATEGSSSSPRTQSPIEIERSSAPRLIDESRVDESLLSLVKCLYFAETFITDATHQTPTLWAGTNSGSIFVYSITIPDEERRQENSIAAEVGKEIKLRHHAPVVSINILDKNGVPLPSLKEVEAGREKPADATGPHSLLICSEEQLKIFALPTLRPKNKEKLTAIDGSRVRRIGMIKVPAKKEEETVDYHCMACLTNLGDIVVYAVPSLRPHMKTNAIKKDNICAIHSTVLTRNGQGFYLRSNTEIQGFCLTVNEIVKPNCVLSPEDSTEDETVLQDTAAASTQNEQKPAPLEPDTESHSPPKSETTSPPDVIPASDKIRSSPETVGNWSVTLTETNTTQNHVPTSEEKVTITTTEEIVKSEDGSEVLESVEFETRETVIVSKTTQQIVTSKTVETVVVNSEEKTVIEGMHDILKHSLDEKPAGDEVNP